MTEPLETPPSSETEAKGQAVSDAERKRRKKKDKIRSAWISFIGRIVAQVVGAVATIVLGVVFLQKYGGDAVRPAGPDSAPAAAVPARTASTTGAKTLVVLPLDNFSPDARQQYFADGMTEALIADLAQIQGLRVISRTSAMQYKDSGKPLPQIARELNVDLVVEGSVVRDGDRLRLTAQLIDARSDEHLWAQTYDRTVRDVLSVQADLAARIAKEIHAASGASLRRADKAPVDPSVFDAYLKGREATNIRSPESLQAALHHFQDAIGRDPAFAAAHAGLAETYALLGTSGYGNTRPDSTMPRAREAAERAIQLEPQSSEGHLSLGYVQHLYDWNWPVAERSYKRALELNPSSSLANQRYAVFLAGLNRYDEALVHGRRAAEVDPLSPNAYRTLGIVHYLGRRYPLAVAALRRSLELDPAPLATHFMLAWSLTEAGDPKGALAACAAAPGGGNRDQILAAEAHAAAKAGERDRALRIRDQLSARGSEVVPSALIRASSGLRDVNAMLAALARAAADRTDVITWLPADPVFDPVRSTPEFARLLRQVGLPPPHGRAGGRFNPRESG